MIIETTSPLCSTFMLHLYKGRMTVTERYSRYSQTSYGVPFKSATS